MVITKSFKEFNTFENCKLVGLQLEGNCLVIESNVEPISINNSLYNQYYFGHCLTNEVSVHFNEAVISWDAKTPKGTWVEFQIRSKYKDSWSKWYSMGYWLETSFPFIRHSFDNQEDDMGKVETDILVLNQAMSGFQIKVMLFSLFPDISPSILSFGITTSLKNYNEVVFSKTSPKGYINLPVPCRSQHNYLGGSVLCSPTSLSMVLGYWAENTKDYKIDKSVPTVAKAIWDKAFKGTGNWSFNTAYVASLGLNAKVVRFHGLKEIESLLLMGIPLVVSIAYKEGELNGAPLKSTNGHLVVVKGFESASYIVVNDPSGKNNEEVEIKYNSYEFEKAWLHGSDGTAYLIFPKGYRGYQNVECLVNSITM